MIRTAVWVGVGWLVNTSSVDLLLVGLSGCQTCSSVLFQRRIYLLNLVNGLGRIRHAVHGSCSTDLLRRRQRGLLGALVRVLYILVGILGLVLLRLRSVKSLGLRWVGGIESRVSVIGERWRSVRLGRVVWLLLVRIPLRELLG